MTASVPVLAFVALEGLLRLVGFGGSYPLFVPVEPVEGVARVEGGYLRMNPRVGHRYFSGDAIVPGVTRDVFERVKGADTYRIVVQGGSTALGYPYLFGGAFPRMLEWRLAETFPERRFEVVNTAMTAVNSYTLDDFGEEIVAIEPDAVLIYAGHNEYYGALGVGSSQRVAGSRSFIRAWLTLRRLRTVQLFRDALAMARGLVAPAPRAASNRTRMEGMVGDRTIPYGSELYERGVEQFRANLEALLTRYREAGIPAYVATVVSNERDQPPFVSAPDPGIGAGEWQRATEAALAAAGAGDAPAARAAVSEVAARDSTDAAAFYRAARALDSAGAAGLARPLYLGAKDRDQLRFRAPEAMNEVIREVAGRTGAVVVDVQAAFADASPGGIPGHELISEHLHPRLMGYFEMADAFYEALRAAGAIGPWENHVSRAMARRELPYTVVDSLHGELRIRALTSGWPFRPAPGSEPAGAAGAAGGAGGEADPADAIGWLPDTERARIAGALFRGEIVWPQAMQALYAHYVETGEPDRARHVGRVMAQEMPEIPTPYVMWGSAALRAGKPQEAIAALETAHRLAPSHRTASLLGSARRMLERLRSR